MAKNEKLEAIRFQIDEIDRQMTALFARRMALADEVAEIKQEGNISLIDNERESAVVENAMTAAPPELKGEVVTFMRALMALSKSRQRQRLYGTAEEYHFPLSGPGFREEAKVAYYVGGGEDAAKRLFPAGSLAVGASFEDIFTVIKDGKASYGVVPIENTQTGGIGEVYDLLRKYGCYIVGQTWIGSTRFIAISAVPEYDGDSDTVSVIFRTAHRSGALVDALFPLMSEEINMTRLESRPTSDGKYCFFCDMKGNIASAPVAAALKNAAASCGYLEVLGCYREDAPVREI